MRNFRIKLTSCHSHSSKEIMNEGKFTMDDEGRIKGFLKTPLESPKWKKSYIIGFKDKEGNIILIKIHVVFNGKIKFPSAPILFNFDQEGEGSYEVYDIFDIEYHVRKKLGENDGEGTAKLNMKQIKHYPLSDYEDDMIVKILRQNSDYIRPAFNMEWDQYSFFKKVMSE